MREDKNFNFEVNFLSQNSTDDLFLTDTFKSGMIILNHVWNLHYLMNRWFPNPIPTYNFGLLKFHVQVRNFFTWVKKRNEMKDLFDRKWKSCVFLKSLASGKIIKTSHSTVPNVDQIVEYLYELCSFIFSVFL